MPPYHAQERAAWDLGCTLVASSFGLVPSMKGTEMVGSPGRGVITAFSGLQSLIDDNARTLSFSLIEALRLRELLNLEMPDVDLHRRKFTLRYDSGVYQVFVELWNKRRLDTNRVFLYEN